MVSLPCKNESDSHWHLPHVHRDPSAKASPGLPGPHCWGIEFDETFQRKALQLLSMSVIPELQKPGVASIYITRVFFPPCIRSTYNSFPPTKFRLADSRPLRPPTCICYQNNATGGVFTYFSLGNIIHGCMATSMERKMSIGHGCSPYFILRWPRIAGMHIA